MTSPSFLNDFSGVNAISGGVQQPAPPTIAPAAPSSGTPWYASLPTSLANAAASVYEITQSPTGGEVYPTAQGPVLVPQQTVTSATWLPWLLIGGAVLVVFVAVDHHRK